MPAPMFRNLSLRNRFLVAPALGIVLTVILYLTSSIILRSNANLFQQLSNTNLPRMSEMSHLTLLLTSSHNRLTEVLISVKDTHDEETVYVEGRLILNAYYKIEEKFLNAFSVDEPMDDQQKEIISNINLELRKYREILISTIELSTVNTTLAQGELLSANRVLSKVSDHLLLLSDYYIKRLSIESGLIEKSIEDHKTINFLAVILIALMVCIAVYFSNRMSSDLGKINTALVSLSKGETDITLPPEKDRYIQPLSEAVLAFKTALIRLQKKEAQLRAILDYSPALISTKDLDGTITLANRQFEVLAGYVADDFVGKSIYDVFPQDIADTLWKNDLIARKGPIEIEEIVEHKDGSFHTYLTVKFPLTNEFGNLVGTCAISTDITQRKKADLWVIENEKKFRSVFQSSVVAMILVTGKGGIVSEWNEGAEKIFGYTAEEIVGKPLIVIIPENLRSTHTKGMERAIHRGTLAHGGVTHELTGLRKDGQVFPMQLTLSGWIQEGKNYFSAVILDITLRKQQEQKIIHQAHYDSLTNLPNRFLSLDRLSQLIQDTQRRGDVVAVLFLDLDDFKKVNDTLGHETGDRLLIEAGRRLLGEVRNGDTVGRLGGDEFIILLSGLKDGGDTIPVVENLLSQFRNAFKVDGRELILTASIGIALYPGDGENSSELLRNADSAMYNSKEFGRNTYSFFTDEMNKTVSRRLALEEQMHGALERKEFTVLYQPQIDINTDRIIGVEALVRWSNPVLGDLFPDEFIPISEQTGLIVPLGQFVLMTSMALVSEWQEISGENFQVAVNLSPRQFRDPNLVSSIEDAISQSGVSAKSLELEITEGVLMSGHAYIDEALASLNRMGVNLSMDDFGTGYSSLSYLRNYPFRTLKIDRSFVSEIMADSADKELVNATIAMAHSLGLTVVAEGVETAEQLLHLKSQGCEYAQGYLFSKPVPSDVIGCMLKNQNP